MLYNNTPERQRDPYEVARRRMVEEQLLARGIKEPRVIEAFRKVRRHEFVNPGMEDQAYLDHPLSIGFAQTISQPLIVAIMTEALELKGNERILEIGTGSGYQAAILAELAREVCTIERIEELSHRARKTIYRLRYNNVKFKIGDGTLGWPEKGPYDGIIVTAGAPFVPKALLDQLAVGGRLVIPVGGEDIQYLELIQRAGGEFRKKLITSCRFVKLTGEQGWKSNG